MCFKPWRTPASTVATGTLVRALNTASSTLDTAERKKLYAAFQKTVTDELPVIFINNSPYHTAARKNVGNLPTTVWGPASPYDEIFLK